MGLTALHSLSILFFSYSFILPHFFSAHLQMEDSKQQLVGKMSFIFERKLFRKPEVGEGKGTICFGWLVY